MISYRLTILDAAQGPSVFELHERSAGDPAGRLRLPGIPALPSPRIVVKDPRIWPLHIDSFSHATCFMRVDLDAIAPETQIWIGVRVRPLRPRTLCILRTVKIPIVGSTFELSSSLGVLRIQVTRFEELECPSTFSFDTKQVCYHSDWISVSILDRRTLFPAPVISSLSILFLDFQRP